MSQPTVKLPKKLGFLFEKHRYKVAYGGRGSAKSWSFARVLVIIAASRTLRIICAREIQKSIKDSVHQLLTDQIFLLGLDSVYEITDNEIRCAKTGSKFIFTGLANHTVTSIKSLEGADLCWVEEAQTVSKKSWDILIPTIRKPESEIWVSFNPDLEDDDTYQRFVVQKPPNSCVVMMNYSDNPWFPEELRVEMEYLKEADYESYKHIWLGHCKSIVEGAIYKAEMEAVQRDGRIMPVPYDPALKVETFWDLGISDSTVIWFIQIVGKEIRCIDYYEARNEGLPHYAEVLDKRGYVYGAHFAPHDIAVRELGSGLSRKDTAAKLGINFERVPNQPLEDGIHAVRMTLPMCYFDAEKTKQGRKCLSNYRREIVEKTGEPRRTPVHDWASHGADAFRYMAITVKDRMDKQKPLIRTRRRATGAGGWMG